MTRGPVLVRRTCPNVGAASTLTGFEKLVWLKMLKNSVRNSIFCFSRIGKNFTRDISRFFWPGPRNELRGTSPQLPAPDGCANAVVSKYAFKRLTISPLLVAVVTLCPGLKFA